LGDQQHTYTFGVTESSTRILQPGSLGYVFHGRGKLLVTCINGGNNSSQF